MIGEFAEGSVMAAEAHPLLKGGRPPYAHGFSDAEMLVLSAFCQTFIPFDFPDDLPDYIAGLMSKFFPKADLKMARLILLLLSTRFGTFLLCGTSALSRKSFPPIPQTFAELSLGTRETVMQSWLLGTGSITDAFFAAIFRLFKTMSLYPFFSRADETGWNPAWKAIGFSLPEIPVPADQRRPLDGKILDVADSSPEQLRNFLEDGGLQTEWTKNEKGNKILKVKCDAVVVGSGAGGGVVAAKLAEAGHSVLVLEKGKYFSGSDFSLLEGPSMTEMYVRGGLLANADGSMSILAGSTVGGGTAINWCASVRTPGHVLQEWSSRLNLKLFQSQEYSAAMDEVCNRGGVNVCKEMESLQTLVLRKGCANLNYMVTDVPVNAKPPHACGLCNFGCRTDDKRSTTATWLVDAVKSGARILTSCAATSILLRRSSAKKPHRANGVICADAGLLIETKATVAACGALMTPGLLHASGLENRHVGRNLHLHPVLMGWGYFPDMPGKAYDGAILTAMCAEHSLGYGSVIQTPAMPPGSFSAVMPWISRSDFRDRMARYPRTVHLFALTRDKSTGHVGPGVRVHYTPSDPSDVANMQDGLERALRILMAAGATVVGTHHSDGVTFDVQGATEDEKEDFLRRVRRNEGKVALISAHQMGSCRMGDSPSVSAVDPNGECWEAEGLFVADASVFPTALGVNPMITIQAIALCVSRRVSLHLSS